MKRSHNRMETEAILHKLRTGIPDAVIRTTLIVGHPGESEDDFQELKKFIADFRFERLGVFAYSHEEDTYSFLNYKDEIPDEIKESRVAELMDLQQTISAEINEAKAGQVIKVIIDRREGGYFIGRSEYDTPEVDQEVLISDKYNLKIGFFYNIKVTESTEFDLFGVPEL